MPGDRGRGGARSFVASLFREAACAADVGVRYEQQRRARVNEVVAQSSALGRLARYSNPIIVAVRDVFFRMIPARVQQQRLMRIVTFPGVAE